MIFADKMIELRKKNGWSQETLAEKLNVSRQTISKWEGAQSVPDFNRMIQLSELFGVSTDYLLKDSMELPAPSPMEQDADGGDTVQRVSMELANAFLEAKARSAGRIALGVGMCILSPVALIVLTMLQGLGRIHLTAAQASGSGLLLLLLLVGGAVALFVLEMLHMEPYACLEKEPIETAYGVDGMVKERREKYRPQYVKLLTVGIVVCVISAAPLFLEMLLDNSALSHAAAMAMLLLLVAIGVMFIVQSSIIWGSFQMLLEVEEYSRANKLENKRNEHIAAIYWGCATAIYLAYSFITEKWGSSWIIWPVAGVSYGVLCTILRMLRRQ